MKLKKEEISKMIELLLSYNYYSGRQFDMPDLYSQGIFQM